MKKYVLRDNNSSEYIRRVKENTELLKDQSTDITGYVDPDAGLKEEYTVEEENFTLSPDGICGVKYLRSFCNENVSEAYSTIRSKVILWPRHRKNINQRRYACFRDRIDYTLYDIKIFYSEGESKLVKKDSITAKYLNSFGNFESFLAEYELGCFVYNGEVVDLVTQKNITSYKQYSYNEADNRVYIEELLRILREKASW